MATSARSLQTNESYHVYNRGNRREPIFRNVYDYDRFLNKAFEYAERDGVIILAYCLMTNHFHFLLLQEKDGAVSRMMRSLSTSAAKYYNWQYGQVGHLFQERYRNRQIRDSSDLLNTAAYIHFNPASFTNYETYEWTDFISSTKLNWREKFLRLAGVTELGYREYVADYAINNCVRQTISGVV